VFLEDAISGFASLRGRQNAAPNDRNTSDRPASMIRKPLWGFDKTRWSPAPASICSEPLHALKRLFTTCQNMSLPRVRRSGRHLLINTRTSMSAHERRNGIAEMPPGL